VQHAVKPTRAPSVLGWRNGDQRVGGGPEQQVVDGLALERDWRDRGRQAEDEVIYLRIFDISGDVLNRREADIADGGLGRLNWVRIAGPEGTARESPVSKAGVPVSPSTVEGL
jgi:hypothetical protein